MSAPYTSPWMNEELALVRETARRFFETEVAPYADKWKKNKIIDREVWLKAGELGLLCASVPTEYGGGGGTFAHEAVIMEEQVRVVDTAFGFVPGSVGGPHLLLHSATHEQRLKWMPKLATGAYVVAVCATEPGAGSDVKTIRTTARRDGDSYVINGSKTFVTLGRQADIAVIAARTGGEGAKGLSLFLAHTSWPGFNVGRNLEKIGQGSLDNCEVFLEDLRVPAENLLGGVEGNAFGNLMKVFTRERLAISLTAVASAERAIALAVDYTKQREMFNQTLFGFQNTRFRLAECLTEARIARTFVDQLILKLVGGEEVDPATSAMAKWWCSQKQCEIVDACLQFFGGYGYMLEYPIAQLYVDARVQKIYGGSNETLKEIIARTL
ncbi:acyl-CoA dehydrogenase family protein [Xanthobacter agilis]|uniref:Acyl-[acyl-carrier-protein] dehydrogenase MbtN n=1 Tax=Xanthobacter agilis TaxID=47492 RepID=A0ABU0L920_XANAG|nr:acyl-CoA dehydrogenase family protein [Xanthobacter agilis]MDQ0503611.1 acyl-CoA dehydrogenase [Xanthobacter agilis]